VKRLLLALALAGCATGAPPITKLVGGREIVTRSVDPNAYEHAGRALVYEEEHRYEDAIAEIKRALIFDREAPELHARLAELSLHLGRLDDAASSVKDSLSLGESVPGLVADAHVRQRRGDLGGAVTSLRRATEVASLSDDPEQAAVAYLELADAQLVALEVEAARESLRALADGLPASVAARVRLAGVAWALGDRREVETRLREALALEPNQLDALLLLAWMYAAEGRGKDAEARFREALERSEGAPEVGAALARYLVSAGATEPASQLVDDLITPTTDDTSLFANIDLARAAHLPARALALARQRREAPDLGDELRGRLDIVVAEILEGQGKHTDAVDTLLAIPKAAPSFGEARVRASSILRDTGRVDQALRALDAALEGTSANAKSEPLTAEVSIALALCEEKSGAGDKALRRLDDTLTRQPGTAKVVLAKAALLERQGRWREALDVVEKLIAAEPGSAEALNFWGFVAADNGHELQRARQRLRAAVALDPGSGAILDSLGWVHLRAGELALASIFIEEAGRLEPEDPEILGHLAELYHRRGERDRAVKTLRKALGGKAEDSIRRKLEEQLRRLGSKGASG
jgi:tetratricopeptide (TPR) repeat protein